jgi:ribosomal protein S18 acetylase RimI-like enzyme
LCDVPGVAIKLPMEIRLLSSDDANEWQRLRLEALHCDPEAFSASLEEYQSLSLEEVKRRLWSDSDTFVVGAFDEDRLVGMAGFYRHRSPKTNHKGHVWGVYVARGVRGKGIGRRMMRMLLDRGAAIGGIEQIMISVTTTQAVAISLYRSLGFESFGCEPRALKVGDRYFDEQCMVLRLKRSDGS